MSQPNLMKPAYMKTSGFTLVELLLTLALLGMVTMAVTNMLIKANSMSSSMEMRYKVATEVQAVLLDMVQDLQQGAYISNNSHQYRLEYTTYNTAGTATKKVYGICYSTANAVSTDTACAVNSGANTTPYLKYSADGGTTWKSPYRISDFTEYKLTGTPMFLYAHDANNCTSFVDTNANGVWLGATLGGTDAAGVFSDCGSNDTSSPVLSVPSDATKVVLSGFQFSSGTGTPVVTRSLPANIFMLAPEAVVASYSAAVSPGVKDNILVKSFDTGTTNSLIGSGFSAYGIQWDPVRQRLIMVGIGPKVFQLDRTGVLIGPGKTLSGLTSGGSFAPVAVALLPDGNTIMVLDYYGDKIVWYSLDAAAPLAPLKTLVLSNPSTSSPSVGGSSSLVQAPIWGLLYDPKWPDEVFVLGQDPADSTYKIFEISTVTGALATNVIAGGKLSLPAAMDTTHYPYGLSQEPTTGDFLLARNYVNGSAPNHTVDIYRITSAGSSSYFSVNTDDLGSTATTSTGGWGLTYDPVSNHVFLTDLMTRKIYEIYPDRLISPRS